MSKAATPIRTITLLEVVEKLKAALQLFPKMDKLGTPLYLQKILVQFSMENFEVSQNYVAVEWKKQFGYNNIDIAYNIDRDDKLLYSEPCTTLSELIAEMEKLLPFEGTVTLLKDKRFHYLLDPENPVKLCTPLEFEVMDGNWRQTKLGEDWMVLRTRLQSIKAMFDTMGPCDHLKLKEHALVIQQILDNDRSIFLKTNQKLQVYLINTQDGPRLFTDGDAVSTLIKEMYPLLSKLPTHGLKVASGVLVCRPGTAHPQVRVFPHNTVEDLIQKFSKLGNEVSSLMDDETLDIC